MILELKDIKKSYGTAATEIHVLDGVNLSIREGVSLALLGQSGSGKSTLLHIASLLDSATSGDVIFNGINTKKMSDNDKTKLRCNTLGFVYQFHNLLPDFTALEYVIMPQIINGKTFKNAKKKAEELICEVSMSHRLNNKTNQLSGGERQRIAIARSLANDPKLVIADEPTGNLDPENASKIFELFIKILKNKKTSLLVATHNVELATQMDMIVRIKNGKLIVM